MPGYSPTVTDFWIRYKNLVENSEGVYVPLYYFNNRRMPNGSHSLYFRPWRQAEFPYLGYQTYRGEVVLYIRGQNHINDMLNFWRDNPSWFQGEIFTIENTYDQFLKPLKFKGCENWCLSVVDGSTIYVGDANDKQYLEEMQMRKTQSNSSKAKPKRISNSLNEMTIKFIFKILKDNTDLKGNTDWRNNLAKIDIRIQSFEECEDIARLSYEKVGKLYQIAIEALH